MRVSVFARQAIEWRYAWPVRFAHHPVCARHRHETWQFGRLYACRGCLALAAGLIIGTGSVLLAGGPWTAPAALLLTPLVLALSWPTGYARLPRIVRDLLRVALGLLIAIGSFVVFSAPALWWPVLPLFAALWWLYRRQRQRVNARRCDGCPELGRGVCSGFAPHAQAMRAIAAALEERLFADDGQSASSFPIALARSASAEIKPGCGESRQSIDR